MNGRKTDGGKREEWRRLIAEAARGGMSIREFCRRRRVAEGQFYSWRARLNGKTQGLARRRALATAKRASFALVSEDAGKLEAGIELVLADGRRVRIQRGADEATLRTVLAAMENGA